MSKEHVPSIEARIREYELIKDSLRVYIPFDGIDENDIGYKLSEIRNFRDKKILGQVASKRPDIYLWLTSLKRSLTPIEFNLALEIATLNHPDKLEEYNEERDEPSVFALAAIYHSVAKDKNQKARLNELRPLFKIKTLRPVKDSFASLILLGQNNAVLDTFYTYAVQSEGIVYRLRKAAINVGDMLTTGGLIGLGIATSTHYIDLATVSAAVTGTAIATSIAGNHTDALQVFINQYSFDDIDRIKQNLVLFNEAIKMKL